MSRTGAQLKAKWDDDPLLPMRLAKKSYPIKDDSTVYEPVYAQIRVYYNKNGKADIHQENFEDTTKTLSAAIPHFDDLNSVRIFLSYVPSVSAFWDNFNKGPQDRVEIKMFDMYEDYSLSELQAFGTLKTKNIGELTLQQLLDAIEGKKVSATIESIR